MDVDFGVEVTRKFQPVGPIICVETPAGRAAVAVHRGAYRGMSVAHDAVHRWCRDNGETIGPYSWEIYGDHADDESRLETTIVYLLA
jgi:effector-binding domain-containing protein